MAETIRLDQTDSEYLLYISASQKERAKSIDGRRWDTERVCWVYPRTGRTYDALIAEFGDDLVSIKITRPSTISQVAKPNFQSENESLKKELAGIREMLTSLPKSNDKATSDLRDAYNQLALRESEINVLRQRAKMQDDEIAELKKTISGLQGTIQGLRNQSANKSSAFSFSKSLKNIAIESTGNDSKFKAFVENLELDENRTSIDLAKALERELRRLLKTSDNTLKLHDLLSQARDANLLPPEAIELAHIIRKQRNIIAHGDGYSVTYPAREILALFAASLLWPEFPE